MFDRILIPTDGSDASEPAIKTALDLAQTHDATLHVLYIVDQPSTVAGTAEGFSGLDDLLDALEKEGQKVTGTIEDQARESNIEIESAVQRGNPHDDILGYAKGHEIDLIVMGTHGRTGVKRALLGSVAESVVRHSEVPVLTVHQDPKE